MSINGDTCSALGVASPAGSNLNATRSPHGVLVTFFLFWVIAFFRGRTTNTRTQTLHSPQNTNTHLGDRRHERALHIAGAAVTIAAAAAVVAVVDADRVLRVARRLRGGQQPHAA